MGKLYKNIHDGQIVRYESNFGPWLVFVCINNPALRYHITAEFSRNYIELELH